MAAKRVVAVAVALVVLVATVAPAQPSLQEQLRHRLAAAHAITTMSSSFTQEKYLSVFSETLKSSGRFYYQRPDKLRWELLEPVASGFVLRGHKGRRWQARIPGSEPFDLDSDPAMAFIAEQLFAWARLDIDWLQQRYLISIDCEQPLALSLRPRRKDGFLERLQIVFAADNSHVQRVEVHEKDGDYTRIIFSATRINQPIDAALFKARTPR